MSTAETLITTLKTVRADELRQELEARRQARDAYLAESDREMELIERLIDVVEPPKQKSGTPTVADLTRSFGMSHDSLCTHSPPVARRVQAQGAAPAVSLPETRASEVSREECIPPNPSTVLGTVSAAVAPAVKRGPGRPPRVPIQLQSTIVKASDVAACLEYIGRAAAGTISAQLRCTREAAIDILENNPQFVADEQGFWDLKTRIEARKEKELGLVSKVH